MNPKKLKHHDIFSTTLSATEDSISKTTGYEGVTINCTILNYVENNGQIDERYYNNLDILTNMKAKQPF